MQVPKLKVLVEAGALRQVAHDAGDQWRPLLDYLSGKLQRLPEG